MIYVRDLLIGCGTLPPVDRFLFLFEQWLPSWLETVADLEQRKTLHRFATWHVLRRLRATAAKEPIGHYRNQLARAGLRQAAVFLTDLADNGRELGQCTQADVDRWFAEATTTHRNLLRPFLTWAIRGRHMPSLRLPTTVSKAPALIGQRQRIALIRRIHAGQDMDLTERVIALLILLYAQSLPRILRLTIDDIIRDGDEVLIRLGNPAIHVPEPFAEVLTRYLTSRSNLTTATNPDSRLLFPGRR